MLEEPSKLVTLLVIEIVESFSDFVVIKSVLVVGLYLIAGLLLKLKILDEELNEALVLGGFESIKVQNDNPYV